MSQPSEAAKIKSLISKLCSLLGSHAQNLSLVESKSRQDLYSDIACFLEHHYERGIFFKMEKTDLFDFLLICLFSKRIMGLWLCLGFSGKEALSIPDSELIQEISEVQEGDYNQKKRVIQDFPILKAFLDFKKTRIRLTSSGTSRNLGGHFFEERQDQLSFLLSNAEVGKWYQDFQNSKEEINPVNPPSDPSELRNSFGKTESFYKFSSE